MGWLLKYYIIIWVLLSIFVVVVAVWQEIRSRRRPEEPAAEERR